MRKLTVVLATLLLIVAVCVDGCKPDDNNNGNEDDVQVTTYTPRDITSTSAVCGGDVIVPQGLSMSSLGVCWSKEQSPTVEDTHRSTTKWNEPFVCTITELEPSTEYHIRAYALRGLICYYGDEVVFTTESTPIPPINLPPNITLIDREYFLFDGDTIDDCTLHHRFGFDVSSNTESNIPLSSLSIRLNDEPWKSINLFGLSTYSHIDTVGFAGWNKNAVFTGIVTDEEGNHNELSFSVFVKRVPELLSVTSFECNTYSNYYSDWGVEMPCVINDQIQFKPFEGSTLYVFTPSTWDETHTNLDKVIIISNSDAQSEFGIPINDSQTIDCDVVIGTIAPDGHLFLIHITRCTIALGEITISGEFK